MQKCGLGAPAAKGAKAKKGAKGAPSLGKTAVKGRS